MAVDLKNLENLYHVVPAKGAAALETYDDLRELDNDLAPGVRALWDDTGETIVAYLFGKGSFTEEDAQGWIDEMMDKGVNLARKFSLDDTSFSDLLSILMFVEWSEFVTDDGASIYPWFVEAYTEYVIARYGGHLYKIPYTLDEKNNVEWGQPEQVKRQYVPLSLKTAKKTHAPDKAFALRLRLRDAPLSAAIQTDDDDLIWKEIFQVSTTYRPYDDDPLEIEQWMIDAICNSFGLAFPAVPITAKDHWDWGGGLVPADETIGLVKRLEKDGGHLYGGLDIKDDTVREKLDDGLIADCSVYIWLDFNDNRSGEKWECALVHLLLTNYPQLPDLAAWGEKPASLAADIGGVSYKLYQEVSMSKPTAPPSAAPEPTQGVTITSEQAALLAQVEAAGLSVDGWQKFQEQQVTLATKLRDAEVKAIVAALQCKQKHAGVVNVEGYAHYPAVVVAVEAALRDRPQALSLTVGDNGETGLDEIVLSIVNALPGEARIALGRPTRPPRDDKPEPTPERFSNQPKPADVTPTDEAIARFDASLGGPPAD